MIYGDNVWDPHFRKALKAILDSRHVLGARQSQPVYSPALGLTQATFKNLNDPFLTIRKRAQSGCYWKSGGRGCPRVWGDEIYF